MELVTKRNIKFVVLAILGFHLILLLLTPFTAWPEMLFWPYLMLKGWLPYENIAIVHTPLLLIDLSAFYALFGIGLSQLKIYTYIVILLTDILLFTITNRLWNKKIAVIALLVYLPLQIFYEGNGLWFDLLLAPYALIIFYFIKQKEFLWAGVFAILAFLTKQTAIWFLIPVAYHLLIEDRTNFLAIKKFGTASLVISIIFIFSLIVFGILKDFYFWGLQFGVTTLPIAQGQISFPTLKEFIYAFFPFGVLVFLFLKKKRGIVPLVLWGVSGVLGVYPRWELFHFQPALPFVSIAFGIVIGESNKVNKYTKLTFYIFVTLLLVMITIRISRLNDSYRFFENDTLTVAEFIDEQTLDNSEIYVINAWDNIYVLSNTVPAIDPWVPHFSWYMEVPSIQEEIVSDLGDSKPVYIIMQPFANTGLSSYRPEQVTEFIESNYELETEVGNYEVHRIKME